METPSAFLSGDGERLHLHHGPIDLVIAAEGRHADNRRRAFTAATARFETLLSELVEELPLLRVPCTAGTSRFRGRTARRMSAAVAKHGNNEFVTPMAAVAGAVAEEILSAMLEHTSLDRAFVNNGGDIALHLTGSATYTVQMSAFGGTGLGTITLTAADGIAGIASSGRHGRSHSMGIADTVTVLARTAAQADVAATLVANAVDLPGHPGISRTPAHDLQPDSDLGGRMVVTGCDGLSHAEVAAALDHGLARARGMVRDRLIVSAAIFLQDRHRTTSAPT